jgi:ankyrin repeat protein
VQYLVEMAGADVHAANAEGNTPLHIASESGHLKVVQYLVEMAGADVHAVNANGHTALHLASAHGQLEVAISHKRLEVTVYLEKWSRLI